MNRWHILFILIIIVMFCTGWYPHIQVLEDFGYRVGKTVAALERGESFNFLPKRMNVESPLMQRFMHWAEAKTGDNRFLVRYYADDEPYLLLPSGLEIPFHCFFDESRRGYQWKFSNEADSSNQAKE